MIDISKFETDGLKRDLVSMPLKIWEQKKKINSLKEAVEKLRLELKEIEANLTIEIASETNGGNKPKFPNAEARAAELIRRKNESAEYQQVFKQLQASQQELEDEQINLELLLDQFSALRAVAKLTAAELTAIS